MDIRVENIAQEITRLRRAHAEILSRMPQEEIVEALAGFAARWRDTAYPPRRQAEQLQNPFPFAMVRISLDALLDSLSAPEMWRLIDSEATRDAAGYPLIGHVIAGNTPLLAWVSIIRALLVRSASLVKLPSGPAAEWGRIFSDSLAEVSPELSLCVCMAEWRGGTSELDDALCRGVDLVMAHGSDVTMSALKTVCPITTPLIGYGHRVSFGLVLQGGMTVETADGFAQDILIYDQGGCLSPQTIFVEGNWETASSFAGLLADALANAVKILPLPFRTARAAPAVHEARLLARMADGNRLWEDPSLRWTVIARPSPVFALSPTFGVVSVQPLKNLAALPEAIAPVTGVLQGCAVAGSSDGYLPGVSYLCDPGKMQAPPLDWRQDGRDVLRLLSGHSSR